MTAELAAPTPSSVASYDPEPPSTARPAGHRAPDYLAAVEQAKEEIQAGEAFQIVVSQRFEARTAADALDIYRVLRRENPSPYMYLLRCPVPTVVRRGLRRRRLQPGGPGQGRPATAR